MTDLRPTGKGSDIGSHEARRVAVCASLGAREFADSLSVLAHTRLLQLDPLARVEKAHRLTCLTRMASDVSVDTIDSSLWSDGMATAFETWVHAACLVPVDDWPLLRLARERARSSTKRPSDAALDAVRAVVLGHPDGATITEIEQPDERTSGWDWSAPKRATEHMLRSGELVCTARRGRKRVFDLPERRLPARVRETHLSHDEIVVGLADAALRAMGIATAADVARYYGLSVDLALAGLIAGRGQPVAVEGWDEAAWIHREDGLASAAPDREVLVGPFDNLIWDRKRVRRVFGFDYVFEAYKPQSKRKYGYYVLALLEESGFTGRVDLRRHGADLEVVAAFAEPSVDPEQFASSLDRALARLRRQLQPLVGV